MLKNKEKSSAENQMDWKYDFSKNVGIILIVFDWNRFCGSNLALHRHVIQARMLVVLWVDLSVSLMWRLWWLSCLFRAGLCICRLTPDWFRRWRLILFRWIFFWGQANCGSVWPPGFSNTCGQCGTSPIPLGIVVVKAVASFICFGNPTSRMNRYENHMISWIGTTNKL